MKRKNIKPLILSSLTALAMGSVSVAGTFALFTDKAETTIQVAAGEVKLGRSFNVISVHELNNSAAITPDASGVYTNSIGGTTTINQAAGTVTLNKWAPGDKLVMDITNVNHSNVKILTRFKTAHSSTSSKDLYDVLNVSFQAISGNEVFHWRAAEIPTSPELGDTINSIRVTIEFPNHGDEITSRDEGIDNAYQNMNCTLVFTQEAVQANADIKSLADVLNTALAESSEVNSTLSDALYEVRELATEAEVKAEKLVWKTSEDRFFYEGELPANADKIDYFAMYDKVPTCQTYSIYAPSSWAGGNSVSGLEVGFDVGNTSIDDIAVSTKSNKHLVYKTNGGTLTIDAPNATFSHYGTANVIEIEEIAGESYHEFGKATFVKIKKGRVVVEKEAKIGGIHIKQVEDNYQEIKIGVSEGAELPALSRDAVSLEASEKKLVVEVQKIEEVAAVQTIASQEYVWIEGIGTDQSKVVISEDKAGATIIEQETQQTEEAIDAKNYLEEPKVEAAAIAEACAVVAPEVPEEEQDPANPTETFVARVGALSGTNYKSFEAALLAAPEGETIVLLDDIESADGLGYSITKNLYLNTNGHKITVEDGSNVNYRAFRIEANKSFSVYGGGTIDALGSGTTSSNGQGCYGAFRAEVGSKLVVKNLTLNNARPYGLNVKVLGAEAELTNVKINSSYGGGIEVTDDEGADGTITGKAVLRNCVFSQQGYFDHCSCAVSVSGASTVDVYSSSFTGEYGAYVFSSGGTINIHGGNWTGLSKNALITSYDAKYGNVAHINVYDGTIRGSIHAPATAMETITIYGGKFDHDPNAFCAHGYMAFYNEDEQLWNIMKDATHVASVVMNENGTSATVTYAYDADPTRTKTEQVRYLTAKNLGSQTTDTTFDVYCGEELIVSGATFSNIFNYNETLLGRNVLALPEGDIYFNGDSYIRSDAIFMIGAKDGDGKPATRLLANGSGGNSVSYKGLQIQNRSGSLTTRNFYFENIIFDGSAQANKWGHLMTMTSYGIDAEFNNVLFQNFTQASRTALIGVWANQTIDGTNSYPTADQNLGVDIRFTNVNVDNINNKPIFQFQGLEAGHIAAVPDCFSYISVVFDQASGTNCGLYSNAAFCTQVNDNLYDYGVHYLWMVNGVEIKSVNGTSVIVY